MAFLFPAVLIAIAVIGIYAVFTYNRLIKSREMVGEAWSGMDVQLKRRSNLIPNLVRTVEGYAEHEKDTIERVTAARSAAEHTPKDDIPRRAENEGVLRAAMGGLLAVAEDYPDLRASESFRDLQANLGRIETDLHHARRYFNATVRDLNTRIDSFPSTLIAGRLGWTPVAYFEIDDDADRAVPVVDFQTGGGS